MYGSQVTDKVENAVPAGGDLLLKLLVTQCGEALIETPNHLLP
jgi:hypothetical protein